MKFYLALVRMLRGNDFRDMDGTVNLDVNEIKYGLKFMKTARTISDIAREPSDGFDLTTNTII